MNLPVPTFRQHGLSDDEVLSRALCATGKSCPRYKMKMVPVFGAIFIL
jgi:hypothetical protein